MKQVIYDSFLEYLRANYTKDFAKVLLSCFEEECLYATREEYDNPEQYKFEIATKVYIQKVALYKAPNYHIDFDVVLKAQTSVTDLVGGELQTNFMDDDFVLSVKGILYNGLKQLSVYSFKKGNEVRPFSHEHSLSPSMIPYISNDEYDLYVDEFLSKFDPEALQVPKKIDIVRIIRLMNLNVEFGPLPETCFGKTIFKDEEIEVYNYESGTKETKIAKPGTIVVDLNTVSQHGGYGFMNATALHECLHWYLHRSYFELQKILNPNISSLSCYVEDMEKPTEGKFRTKYFIEQQAKNLTYHILMPKEQSKKKFKSIVAYLKRTTHLKKKNLYEKAVSEFANFFGTTLASAKIRLDSLGFTQVECIETDGENNIKFFKTGNYIQKPNESFIINPNQAFELLRKNAYLRALVSTGIIAYVDNMFVLNSPKFIKTYKNKGKVGRRMTARALNDVSKCCFVFSSKMESVDISYNPEVFNSISFYSGGYTSETNRSYTLPTDNEQNEKIQKDIKAKIDEGMLEYKASAVLLEEIKKCSSFTEKFNLLLSKEPYNSLSNYTIGARSGTSEGNIRKIKKGEKIPQPKEMFALISAIGIEPIIASHFIKCLGGQFDLNADNEAYAFYTFLAQTFPNYGVDLWNEMIRDKFDNSVDYTLP